MSSTQRHLPVDLQQLYRGNERAAIGQRAPDYGRANTERLQGEKERDCLEKIMNLQKKFSEVKNDVYNSFKEPEERLKCSERMAALYFSKQDPVGSYRAMMDESEGYEYRSEPVRAAREQLSAR